MEDIHCIQINLFHFPKYNLLGSHSEEIHTHLVLIFQYLELHLQTIFDDLQYIQRQILYNLGDKYVN